MLHGAIPQMMTWLATFRRAEPDQAPGAAVDVGGGAGWEAVCCCQLLLDARHAWRQADAVLPALYSMVHAPVDCEGFWSLKLHENKLKHSSMRCQAVHVDQPAPSAMWVQRPLADTAGTHVGAFRGGGCDGCH